MLEICEQAGYINILNDAFINLTDKDKKTKIMPVVNRVICNEMQKRVTAQTNTNQQQNASLLKHSKDKLVK